MGIKPSRSYSRPSHTSSWPSGPCRRCRVDGWPSGWLGIGELEIYQSSSWQGLSNPIRSWISLERPRPCSSSRFHSQECFEKCVKHSARPGTCRSTRSDWSTERQYKNVIGEMSKRHRHGLLSHFERISCRTVLLVKSAQAQVQQVIPVERGGSLRTAQQDADIARAASTKRLNVERRTAGRTGCRPAR